MSHGKVNFRDLPQNKFFFRVICISKPNILEIRLIYMQIYCYFKYSHTKPREISDVLPFELNLGFVTLSLCKLMIETGRGLKKVESFHN